MVRVCIRIRFSFMARVRVGRVIVKGMDRERFRVSDMSMFSISSWGRFRLCLALG
jgi:hypothetical protein